MRTFRLSCIVCVVLFSCAPRPPAPPPAIAVLPPAEAAPLVRIVDVAVAARGPNDVALSFSVTVENPLARELPLEGVRGELMLDGVASLTSRAALPLTVATGGTLSLPFAFDVDLRKVDGGGAEERDSIEYAVVVTADVKGPDGKPMEVHAEQRGTLPRIREPILRITSISIDRAELINTRLDVGLRIENPNPFPVQLRSLSYELFGEGSLWADGVESETLSVPGRGSADAELALVMNFIDMKRGLLDQVIALEEVRYRFKGEAIVETGVAFLPEFRMQFDAQGSSRVIE